MSNDSGFSAGRTHPVDRPPFLIRAAEASDLPYVHNWLPDAMRGTPAARLVVAADAATGAVAGVAALRAFIDRVARFLLYVDPKFRRRGCGTDLLDRVLAMAPRAGVHTVLTDRSYDVDANDDASNTARAFLQARGLVVAQEIRRCRAQLTSAITAVEPMYQRCRQRLESPLAPTIVPVAQVDPEKLASFVVSQVGGVPEDVTLRLRSSGEDLYSPAISLVALLDKQIVGALLAIRRGHNVFVGALAVDARHRGGGLNLALMHRMFAAAAALGMQTIEFEHDTKSTDIARLAKRFGASQLGCRQCWGVSFSASTPVSRQQALDGSCPPGGGRGREDQPALRAVHTPNFPALLRELDASLLITTYQADKLMLVHDEGDRLNACVRAFQAPMGLALDGDRLAIATRLQVHEFANVPGVAAKLEPPGQHGACYLPRASHFTGNIKIHDMAWDAGGALWIVNSRFSCLCTLDHTASFTPRWRPAFISELDPSDRCHLNGLGMVERKPKYVTACGETDTAAGWRENQASSGVVIDVHTGAVLARGLSLPHSPRWHDGRLWLCESGTGTFGCMDLNTGKYQPVAETPGFPRGLDFAGPFAFVGLSQLHENAAGLKINERLAAHERTCGVCAIDLRSGQLVALLRFEEVQDVVAVAVTGQRFPALLNDDEKLLESSYMVRRRHLLPSFRFDDAVK